MIPFPNLMIKPQQRLLILWLAFAASVGCSDLKYPSAMQKSSFVRVSNENAPLN